MEVGEEDKDYDCEKDCGDDCVADVVTFLFEQSKLISICYKTCVFVTGVQWSNLHSTTRSHRRRPRKCQRSRNRTVEQRGVVAVPWSCYTTDSQASAVTRLRKCGVAMNVAVVARRPLGFSTGEGSRSMYGEASRAVHNDQAYSPKGKRGNQKIERTKLVKVNKGIMFHTTKKSGGG